MSSRKPAYTPLSFEDFAALMQADSFDPQQCQGNKSAPAYPESVYKPELHDPTESDHEDVDDNGDELAFSDTEEDIYNTSNVANSSADPEIQPLIDRTTRVLEDLSFIAQSTITDMPMSTQILLAHQAADMVFKPYSIHGSQAQLSASAMKFLMGGETIRRPGPDGSDSSKDGRLRLTHSTPQTHGSKRPRDDHTYRTAKMPKRDPSPTKRQTKSQPGRADVEDPVTALSYRKTSDPLSEQKDDSGADTEMAYTPLASTFCTLDLNPDTATNTNHTATISTTAKHSCSSDPVANAALAEQPFDPITLDVTWPSQRDGQKSLPTPGYLDALNTILHLYNAKARAMLSYHVRKYAVPVYIGGRECDITPPHALFRLGISQFANQKVSSIVNQRHDDPLGLTPEARRVLSEVWEKQPDVMEVSAFDLEYGQMRKKQNGVNPVETALLARACGVDTRTVDAFWNGKNEKTRGWIAMRVWCQSQMLGKIRRAKIEGTW